MEAEGLTITRRLKNLENGLNVRFELISAGDKMLEAYAEILQLRMPLKRDEKMENLEFIKPKHGFHILAWIHHIMKTKFPELMKKVTPSLPSLKVFLKTIKFLSLSYFYCRMFFMTNTQSITMIHLIMTMNNSLMN